jgi:hypothetical protein
VYCCLKYLSGPLTRRDFSPAVNSLRGSFLRSSNSRPEKTTRPRGAFLRFGTGKEYQMLELLSLRKGTGRGECYWEISRTTLEVGKSGAPPLDVFNSFWTNSS